MKARSVGGASRRLQAAKPGCTAYAFDKRASGP
jgi:hypothetical protein